MAGRIPQAFIDDLLSRIDIVDVISARVELKKSGANYSACCPFHNEKTPSFTVSQSKQFYHCFGCQANGSAISFLMNYDQLHFVDAIETLAQTIGMEVPREADAQNRENSRKPLFDIMEQCAHFYIERLKKSPDAVEYLKRRKLSGETARKFGIGFAPRGWQNLETGVKADHEKLIKLGMQIRSDEGRVYDRFRERIMFPIRDRRGRVIAFGGRILDTGEPKYLNSPETPLFHKSEELYGFFEARKHATSCGKILVVEGYMDVVALSQHGVENTVATLGTATSTQHIELLFRTVPDIYFCFDGDRAGKEAAWRALKATLPALQDGRNAHFSFLPNGEDPDSYISKFGKDAFNTFLSNAITASEFLVSHLSQDLDTAEIGGKARLAQLSKPLIKTLPNGIYKQLTIKTIEDIIGTKLGTIEAEQNLPSQENEHARPSRATPVTNNNPSRSHHSSVLKRAVCLLLQLPEVVRSIEIADPVFEADSPGAGAPFTSLRPEANGFELLIGPEGGFDEAEIDAAQTAEFHAVSLGPRILRTETAGLASIAILQSLYGDLN
ncbi:unnamed protein product [Cyprideis torosa]|uniref:16S rRNA (uracil(1498)-N(3))-methyltransferase n=1 Tax=Cyprideis torosa TaxID=163714 RepID=A0A7R8ZJ10_9CRUS|nr:unnamed protein product [Cyprideis torosa]CAG0878787.1 unnamed protein product [Cyprideis torosa]